MGGREEKQPSRTLRLEAGIRIGASRATTVFANEVDIASWQASLCTPSHLSGSRQLEISLGQTMGSQYSLARP